MGCAGDARVVVANGLFALPPELIGREIEVFRHEFPKIALDSFLILRCRWNDLRVENHSLPVNAITVVKNAAWRFGTAVARGWARANIQGRLFRCLIPLDYP